jgi:hypothetical protein
MRNIFEHYNCDIIKQHKRDVIKTICLYCKNASSENPRLTMDRGRNNAANRVRANAKYYPILSIFIQATAYQIHSKVNINCPSFFHSNQQTEPNI